PVKVLAPSLKDAGLAELEKLGMFKLDPAKEALLNKGQGAAVRALPPLEGREVADIEATLTNAGFTKVADERGQAFWAHPDGSIVRLKTAAPALTTARPNTHAVKEISKTANDFSQKAVFAKVADNGAVLSQGTNAANENLRQWFNTKAGRNPTPV